MISEYWIVQQLRDDKPYKNRSFRTKKMMQASINANMWRTYNEWSVRVYYTNLEQSLILLIQSNDIDTIKKVIY